MDAFLSAFIAALVTQIGDRNAWFTAILADRYGKPLTVALGAGLAHAAGNLVAAGGGIIIAPSLTPRAQLALMALALFFAALGALWPLRQPKRLDHVRLGALVTSFCGVFALAIGDRTQFLTLAIAASAPLPWLAAAGATLGALAVAFVAAMLGEPVWRGKPVRIWRIGSGIVLLLACAATGLSAAGLV